MAAEWCATKWSSTLPCIPMAAKIENSVLYSLIYKSRCESETVSKCYQIKHRLRFHLLLYITISTEAILDSLNGHTDRNKTHFQHKKSIFKLFPQHLTELFLFYSGSIVGPFGFAKTERCIVLINKRVGSSLKLGV